MTSKFIASGSYGCVFRPALQCNHIPDVNVLNNKITKLTTKKTSISIGLKLERIKQLPDYSKYFIVTDDNLSCDFNDTINVGEEINKCFANKPNLTQDNLFNAVMHDGGISLSTFMNDINQPHMIEHKIFVKQHFRYLIIFLLKSLVSLNDGHCAHCDLKPENIVINTDVTISHDEDINPMLYFENRVRIIDYDLLIQFEHYDNAMISRLDIYNELNQIQTDTYIYTYYPPEYILSYYIFELIIKNPNINNEAYVHEIAKKYDSNMDKTIKSHKIDKLNLSSNNDAFIDVFRNIKIEINALTNYRQKMDFIRVVKRRCLDKIDIYSIGLILQMLKQRLDIDSIDTVFDNLIIKMMEMNYDIRISIIDIKHFIDTQSQLQPPSQVQYQITRSPSPIITTEQIAILKTPVPQQHSGNYANYFIYKKIAHDL
jgi:serine/threonine protein kinase